MRGCQQKECDATACQQKPNLNTTLGFDFQLEPTLSTIIVQIPMNGIWPAKRALPFPGSSKKRADGIPSSPSMSHSKPGFAAAEASLRHMHIHKYWA